MKNQKGFGLIELMITLGIMSVVMLGVMQMMHHAMMVSLTADQKANLTSIVTSSAGIALNNVTCTAAITKVENTYGQPLQFGNLSAGASLDAYHLTTKSLSYRDAALVATGYDGVKAYYGVLTLVMTSNRQILGGNTFAPRVLAAVYLTVDTSNKITGCGPIMPILATAPVVTVNTNDEDFKKGCAAVGGVASNGVCTISSTNKK